MGSTQEPPANKCGTAKTFETLDFSVKQKIRQFEREPTTTKLIDLIKGSDRKLTVRFPSAEGHHYINYNSSGELVAVYVGPYGPENRPKPISEVAIEQLLEHADDVSVHHTEQTNFGKD